MEVRTVKQEQVNPNDQRKSQGVASVTPSTQNPAKEIGNRKGEEKKKVKSHAAGRGK
jgi:hypothetical protein